MSNQSKPTTGKRKSCDCDDPSVPHYPEDHLITPKPTGEWTAVYERNSDGWYVCDNNEPVIEWPLEKREAKAIADAHNAALAAEQEEHAKALLAKQARIEIFQKQLTAQQPLMECLNHLIHSNHAFSPDSCHGCAQAQRLAKVKGNEFESTMR